MSNETDIRSLREQLARLEAAQAPGAAKMVKSGYAAVSSTAESDEIERLLVAEGTREAMTVEQACKKLGYEYVEHVIPEGTTGPIVVIVDREAEQAAQDSAAAADKAAQDDAKNKADKEAELDAQIARARAAADKLEAAARASTPPAAGGQ